MPFHPSHTAAALALLLGAAALTGCKKKPPTSADPAPSVQPDQPAPGPNAPSPGKKSKADAPAVEVEVSDVKVAILGPKMGHVSLKYRFTAGAPAAGEPYLFTLDYTFGEGEAKGDAAVILAQKAGAEFQAEGVLEGPFQTFKPVPPGATFDYTAKAMKGRGKGGPYRDVSNVVKGSVTYAP